MSRRQDLTGNKYNKLTVLDYSGKNNRGESMWNCLCDCGNLRCVKATNLIRKQTQSCGCIKGPARDDSIIGKRFNHFVVIKFSHKTTCRDQYYICLCDCGKEFKSTKNNIKRKYSCGCKGVQCKRIGFKEISGHYWSSVKSGASMRNLDMLITVEEAWDIFIKQNKICALSGVEINFKSETLSQTASLDRIDSKLGYTKENCQWVHKDVNVMKMATPEKDFYEWCKKIYFNKKDKYEEHS